MSASGHAPAARSLRVQGVGVPVLYALVLVPLFFGHDLFEEWDGVVQVFSGRELLAGSGYHGWTSHFWPPLYSLLVGAGSLFLPGFEAAKLVSCVAGVLLLYVAYRFALELSGDVKIGVLTQLFLALNPLYVLSSVQAENHMLDSLFFVSGLLLFLKALRQTGYKAFVVTGLVCGLAGLSRYTSYALIPIAVIVPFCMWDVAKAAKAAAAFLVGFSLVSSPWWYYNAAVNGSPFHSWQYLNIGAHIAPTTIGGREWSWNQQSSFNGIRDIFRTWPVEYLQNILRNLVDCGRLLVRSAGVLAVFTLPALFDSVLTLGSRSLLTLFGLLAVFSVLVSQAFVFDQVFLSWAVIMTVLSVMFLRKFLDACQARFPRLKGYRFTVLVVASLSVASLALTSSRVVAYFGDRSDHGDLADNDEVIRAIRAHDPDIAQKFIMAVHPGRAYYTGAKYLMMPLYYEGSLEGLVSYAGMTERIKTYAPKYPSVVPNADLKADYLVYDAGIRPFLPQFSYLLEPGSGEIPANFKLVYRSAQAAVYEIRRP